MYTLAFDTTANSCSLALFEDEACIGCHIEEMAFGQAEALMPAIQKMLKEHDLEFSRLNALCVCVGPGSFTGVRSGISAARAFGLACPDLNVLGVSAFEGYINSLVWTPEQIAPVNAVIIETKRADFYFQLFDSHLKKISEPSAAMREDIIDALRNKKITVLGDGAERFLSAPTGLSLHAVVPGKYPDIKDIALQGIKKYRNKILDYPKPLYLRAPDVCIKSERTGG